MAIAIIDADLLGRTKHRFPNLVCMKLSAYWQEMGHEVELKLDYEDLEHYERVYIAKVFTDTECPVTLENLADYPNVEIGGTGFYFDKAPNLPEEIEHHIPDYHLYDEWIEAKVEEARAENPKLNETSFRSQFKEYTDYSIGFLTRGCFRKCKFCVNQKYSRVFVHSPLAEFYDAGRKKICLLDDNFLGYPHYRELLEELIATGKPFKFKQGLDERILNEEKCRLLFNAKYDGDFTFAFDNISDYDLIERQLKCINKYRSKRKGIMFYVLVGFESTNAMDIINAFKRVELLLRYGCIPYIMRYRSKDSSPWKESRYRSMYVTLARWCNQPHIVKKMTFREFCEANQNLHKTPNSFCSAMRSMIDFENDYPEEARKYFDMRFAPHVPKEGNKNEK